MFRALYTAASGMAAQQLNLDTIANNLANSSTAGFQQRRVQFSDLLYQSEIMPGAAASQQTTVAAGVQVGLGTKTTATELIMTQGTPQTTGNPLDPCNLWSRLLPGSSPEWTDGLHPCWFVSS